jgi:hypothetical protein
MGQQTFGTFTTKEAYEIAAQHNKLPQAQIWINIWNQNLWPESFDLPLVDFPKQSSYLGQFMQTGFLGPLPIALFSWSKRKQQSTS